MKLTEVFNSQAIAANWTEVASNAIPYLGTGFFTPAKKAGLDLKWIKGHKDLPISLMPSAFDAKATFRDRVGVSFAETEMPFFREAFLIKEKDRQEIMRVKDSNDPYAQTVLDNIFNDARNLIDGAEVVAERMRMQLLAPLGGNMGIEIKANDVDYTYNYDPNGEWKKDHYMKLESAEDKWTASETCDPLADMEQMLDQQEAKTGTRPEILLMSKPTFMLIKNSKKVQSGVLAQNVTANVNYTTNRVKAYVEEELKIKIVTYSKKFKDEAGKDYAFYPDNIIMMLPNGSLGKMWYGTTPEEADLQGGQTGASVSIVNTGVAVTTIQIPHPVNTETIVSEIVLPSFERMSECCALEVAGD